MVIWLEDRRKVRHRTRINDQGGAGVAGRGRRGARRVLVHGVVGGGGVEPLVEERRALHRDEENRAEEVHRDFEVGPLLRVSAVVDLSILAVL